MATSRATQDVGVEDAAAWSTIDRLDVFDVGAEALQQRPHRGHDHPGRRLGVRAAATAPAGAGPWSRRRAHPLERQRLPGREQLDVVGAEVLRPGRRPGARRRCRWAWRPRSGGAGRAVGQAGDGEGPGRLRHGQDGVGAAGDVARAPARRAGAGQGGQATSEGWSTGTESGHRDGARRAPTRSLRGGHDARLPAGACRQVAPRRELAQAL